MRDEIQNQTSSELNWAMEARLANIEYSQIPLTREFLENLREIIILTQPRRSRDGIIRIGQQGDGGYVISPRFNSMIGLNLGVGFEVTADLDLLNRGFTLFAYDGTVPNPLPGVESYCFSQRNIGYSNDFDVETTLGNIFSAHPELEILDLLLMDIEGHEYAVLEREMEYVSKAKQIVIEFHGLELIFDNDFSRRLVSILQKLSSSHTPIHVHANNAMSTLQVGGANWPTTLEVTFMQKEFCGEEFNYGPYPTVLDFPNSNSRPDIDLSPFYSQNKSYSSLARNILGIS
jgi:glutaredoxin-related protein